MSVSMAQQESASLAQMLQVKELHPVSIFGDNVSLEYKYLLSCLNFDLAGKAATPRARPLRAEDQG